MEKHLDFVKALVQKGGPDVEDFYDLDAWIAEVAEGMKSGQIDTKAVRLLREMLGDTLTPETMQGFVLTKPHGYAGDYEIIDRIYTRYISGKANLSKWDVYMHEHAAVNAVRNRVTYFRVLLEDICRKAPDEAHLRVLNLASGPGRDMLAFFTQNPDARIQLDCVEQDMNAVEHASNLCRDYLDRITFHQRNALRFNPEHKYDLIWSAGLFDYFSDKIFEHMLRRLRPMVASGGQIVIGNFSTVNPSQPYMELMEWRLNHRSPNTLRAFALAAGFPAEKIHVGREDTGVNLFLHLRA